MTHLDVVLRELEDVGAALAGLGSNGGGAEIAALQQRLRACAALLERERWRSRELFDLAAAAYVLTDAEGRIEEANQAAGELLGRDRQRLRGVGLADLVAAESRARFADLLAVLRGEEGGTEHELSFQAGERHFVADVVVDHVRHGPAEGALRWMLRDVTDRSRAVLDSRRRAAALEQRVQERTQELEQERALLEAVIQQMPAGVTITDARSGGLLIANTEAWRIARERFEQDEGLEPLVRALTEHAGPGSDVLETAGSDGTYGAIELSVAPLHDPDGHETARVTVFRDVTARERLERAEREFITNAAHELQTPLTAITSAAEVLQAGAKETPADRDHFLAHIQRECDRLARLVRALLVLARAQSKGSAADAEPLPLRGVLDEVAALLRPSDGVVVEVRCPPRLTALANRELTEQAITSIAANASKFTPAGTIRLSARRLDRDRVAVEVSDTGPGIPAGELELVRERFYRGAARDRSGFGLGLAIAEQAARALHGSLELEARPGGGTTARLILPGRRR